MALIASSLTRVKSSSRQPGSSSRARDQLVILGQVVDVRLADERGHLLVDLDVERGRHREHRVGDLLVREFLRAALGDHHGGQRGQARFLDRIRRRAGRKDKAEGHERRLAGHLHDADLRRGGGGEQEEAREQSHWLPPRDWPR